MTHVQGQDKSFVGNVCRKVLPGKDLERIKSPTRVKLFMPVKCFLEIAILTR